MKKNDRYRNALAGMIDHAQLMSRTEWADQLHVSEAAITFWLQEKSVPQPIRLKKIIDKIENSQNEVGLQFLDKFMQLVDEHVEAVSNIPHKFKHAKTISEYLLKSNQDQVRKTSNSLPHVVRRKVLEMTQDLIAASFTALQFEGKSTAEVLDELHHYQNAEEENESILEIFATFYVLLVKVEPGKSTELKKADLKNILSQKNLLESGATGAILELGEQDKMVNPFKDLKDMKRILEKRHAIVL
jgi:predicted transcriptional regulator